MNDTPRTAARRAKTLTPAYEYEGAEGEAWEWARELELEVAKWKNRCLLAEEYISESPCDPDIYPEQLEAYEKWQEFKWSSLATSEEIV